VIKYLGSKRLLLPHLLAGIGAFEGVRRVLDPFSGTARVGRALRGAGYEVLASDHNRYASLLARCYVAADRARVEAPARALLAELAELEPRPGYVTRTFCEDARFFHPKNGARIDAIRASIAERALEPELEAVALVSLLEAADRVDSTTGVQMAYLKQWATRAHKDLELRLPELVDGIGHAYEGDAREIVRAHEVDLVYLDPPYNRTTSTATSATTTRGRRSRAAMRQRPSASRRNASTCASARARSIVEARSALRSRT